MVPTGLKKFLERSPIGVSKRSCPACHEILSAMYRHYKVDKYVSAGSRHREVFPCSFPAGLPLEVMKEVVAYFRTMLTDKLAKLADLGSKRSSNQSEPGSREAMANETQAHEDESEAMLLRFS